MKVKEGFEQLEHIICEIFTVGRVLAVKRQGKPVPAKIQQYTACGSYSCWRCEVIIDIFVSVCLKHTTIRLEHYSEELLSFGRQIALLEIDAVTYHLQCTNHSVEVASADFQEVEDEA